MGYHLILRNADGTIDHCYAPSIEALCKRPGIKADAIIYQGEEHWTPVVIGDDERYKLLAKDWYRAGINAQGLFRTQAIAARLIPEQIAQDKDSFEAYRSAAASRIKRGDFLLRRLNLEVDVKCLSFYNDCFYLPYSDVMAHKTMEEMSGTPVCFAVYQRSGEQPVVDSLRMIHNSTILAENNRSVEYHEAKKCFVVPLSLTLPGFACVEQART